MEQNNPALDIGALNEKIEKESAFIDILSIEINKVIIIKMLKVKMDILECTGCTICHC